MGATKQTVDMTNVKDGGNFNKKRLPEGDYTARVTKVEDAVAKKDGKPQWLFTIEVKHRGAVATYPYYCKLEENQLWKIRQLFAAAGTVIPKKRISIDPNRMVNKTIGVTLEDTEYNDKLQSQIQACIPVSEVSGSAADADDEDEFDEDEETEEEGETEEVEEDGDEETEEEDEEEEDEEEEPEPAPRRTAKKAAPTPPPAPAKKVAAKKNGRRKPIVEDDDEMDEIDIDI